MLMASASVLLNFLVCVCVCDCCKCVNANTLCLNAESSQQKHKISMHTYVYILVCVFVSKMLVELLLPLLCGSEFFANKQHNFFLFYFANFLGMHAVFALLPKIMLMIGAIVSLCVVCACDYTHACIY